MDPSALYRSATVLSASVAWIKRRRRLDPSSLLIGAGLPARPVKVNLGSSLVVAPGWVNVDGSSVLLLRKLPGAALKPLSRLSAAAGALDDADFVGTLRDNLFVHHDLRYGLPFIDSSADVILAAHFLEHLSRSDAVRLLGECRRGLRRGGTIRISVPDAAPALEAISEGRTREGLEGLFADDQHREADYHRFAYDEALLREVLQETGFTDVTRRQPGEGDVPDLDILDSRPAGSLFVEAKSPSA